MMDAQVQRAPRQGLGLRLLTAAIALPVLLAVVWAGTPWVGIVAALAAAVALREASALLRGAGHAPPTLALVPAGTAIAALGLTDWRGVLAGFGAASVLVLGIALYRCCATDAFRGSAWSIAVLAYVALPLAALVLLRERPLGLEWLALGFLGVFATDSAAFFVGRAIGRHRMAPSISPGKTWEGAAGGLLGGAGATIALVALLDIPWVPLAAVGIGVGIAVLAQAGDLAESKLKRLAGAKDSGALFPGHGGLLDRMDSLLPVFLLLYYGAVFWPS